MTLHTPVQLGHFNFLFFISTICCLGCGSYFLLVNWTMSEINQNSAGYTYDGFFFLNSLKWEDSIVHIFWGGKIHLQFGPHLLAAYVKDMETGSLPLFACSRSLWQVRPFFPFFGIRAYFGIPVYVNSSWDIQLCGLNSYWILGPSNNRQSV